VELNGPSIFIMYNMKRQTTFVYTQGI